ncbi:ferritin family protein [Candidatus Woesearchaeota archaeon]|nr:ferritin family protein [Candidatus Woesearchaeota archaeon]
MEKEFIEALKYALDFEEKGEKIYRDIAENSEDDFVKNTFNGLADDEVVHEKVIKGFIGGNADFSELKKVTLDPKRFFGTVTEEFKKRAKMHGAELKPFDIGIELEKQSIAYYKEQLEKASTEEAKKFFEFLVKQEQFHLKSLQQAKDFLGDPENFYVEFERWSFGG